MQKSKKIFIVLSLFILCSDLIFIGINYYASRQALQDSISQIGNQVRAAFELSLSSDEYRMLQVATFIANDARVQQLVLQGRTAVEAEGGGAGGMRAAEAREKLYQLVAPGQKKLAAEFGFRQIHFHLGPGSTSFLRVHSPEKFGDNMDAVRHTVVACNQQVKSMCGFETGRIYSGIRGVVPVMATDDVTGEQVHVGALEAGTSFDTLLTNVAEKQHVEIAVLLTVDHLKENVFPDYLEKLFRQTPPVNGFRVEASTDDMIDILLGDGVIAKFEGAPATLLVEVGGVSYGITGFPLRDYRGQQHPALPDVGMVIAWRDASHEVGAFVRNLRVNICFAIVGLLFIEMLLYLGIKSLARRLDICIEQGRIEVTLANEALRRDIEARKEVEEALSSLKENLEMTVAERTRELEKANRALLAENAVRRITEAELEKGKRELEQANTALKVLLQQVTEAKEEIEEKVSFNIKELILPHLEALEAECVQAKGGEQEYIEAIKSNLQGITSSFGKNLQSSCSRLTPRELQIANFITHGKTNKEIAAILKITPRAVEFHRDNIRAKFGIKNRKKNLKVFLNTLSQ
ncbi:MAG: cache domain-containing protein [Thermodesulfobacteriota bacterium]